MTTRGTTHLSDLLTDLRTGAQGVEPGRPRITWYALDDSGATTERVELSGAVLANWASKATHLVRDELCAGVGTTLTIDLPVHWRALYWALAAWTAGATVRTGGPAEVVVTADPAHSPQADDLVVVTLPALARTATVEVPPGAVDEAVELSSFGDLAVPAERPEGWSVALEPLTTFAVASGRAGRRLEVVDVAAPVGPWLAAAATTLAQGGSLVVVQTVTDSVAVQSAIEGIRRQETMTEE